MGAPREPRYCRTEWRPLFGLYGILKMTLVKDAFFVHGVGGGNLVYANTLLVPPTRRFAIRSGVDPDGRAFGYDDLYVIDGSTIPANLGVNPSLAITAMAERAMTRVPPRASRSGAVWE